jgi:prepilin-type processing-associated H-X9-DG protein
MKRRIGNNFAFALLELFAILAVIFLLFALVMAAIVKAHAKAQRISCVNNLKNVGLAFRLAPTETGKSFLPTNSVKTFDDLIVHWKSMTNEAAWVRGFIICPADTRNRAPDTSFSRTNASYFVALTEPMPQDILMGDRNITTNGVSVGPGVFRIDTNSVMGWDRRIHKFRGNVAMGDGSVMLANSASLTKLFTSSGTNSLAVP